MKKDLVKRVICILLAVFMTLGLCACGSETVTSEYWVYEDEDVEGTGDTGTEDASSSDGEKSGSTKNPTTSKNPNKNKNTYDVKLVDVGTKGANGKDYSNYDPYAGIEKYKGTTIKFATWIDHSKDEMATPIEEFEDKYGIKIESVYCAQNGYIKEVLALIAADNAPDIIVANDTFPAVLQVAQPASVMGLDTNEPFWSQRMLNALSHNGTCYFVNAVNSVVGMNGGITVFNKDLLESNDIKTPAQYYAEGQWTLSNLNKLCKQVCALGSDYSGAYFDGIYLYPQFGGSSVSYDGKKFTNTLTSAGMIEGLKNSLERTTAGYSADMAKFVEGKAGVFISDMYSMKASGYLRSMDPDSLGFTYLPRNDSASSETTVSLIRGYGVSKGSKNPKAAGYVLRYLLDGENYDFADNCFINEEAANFFYETANKYKDTDIQYFYDNGVAAYVGSWWGYWVRGAESADQASVALQSHNNEVQSAVDKTNEFLSKLK